MNSSTLFCLICTSMVIANTAGSKHLNIKPEKNETDENIVSDQNLPGNEARPDYLYQIVRELSSVMERMDRRLRMCEEMYKNLSDGMASLRLDLGLKNLSSVAFPEQPSKPPPPIVLLTEPTTQAPELKPTDSFAQKESPFVLDVSTLRGGRGAIVFDGKKMAPKKEGFGLSRKLRRRESQWT